MERNSSKGKWLSGKGAMLKYSMEIFYV